jgi:hypothetical protein
MTLSDADRAELDRLKHAHETYSARSEPPLTDPDEMAAHLLAQGIKVGAYVKDGKRKFGIVVDIGVSVKHHSRTDLADTPQLYVTVRRCNSQGRPHDSKLNFASACTLTAVNVDADADV